MFDAFEGFATEALSNIPEARTVTQILTPWTEQSGYPVLRVSIRDGDAVITQVGTINEKLTMLFNPQFEM